MGLQWWMVATQRRNDGETLPLLGTGPEMRGFFTSPAFSHTQGIYFPSGIYRIAKFCTYILCGAQAACVCGSVGSVHCSLWMVEYQTLCLHTPYNSGMDSTGWSLLLPIMRESNTPSRMEIRPPDFQILCPPALQRSHCM